MKYFFRIGTRVWRTVDKNTRLMHETRYLHETSLDQNILIFVYYYSQKEH